MSAQYLSQLCDTKRGFIEKIRQINQEIPHCSKTCLLCTLRKHKVIMKRFTNENTISSSSNKFRAKLIFLKNKTLVQSCMQTNAKLLHQAKSHGSDVYSFFSPLSTTKYFFQQNYKHEPTKKHLTKQNIKIISFDRRHLKKL